MGGGWVLKVNLVIALAEPEPSLGQAEQFQDSLLSRVGGWGKVENKA